MTMDMLQDRHSSGIAVGSRRIFSPARQAANALKTAVFLAALGGLFVAVGSLFGRTGALFGLLVALAVVGGSYWFPTPSPSVPPEPSR
jgi:hypothetical protein